MHICYFQENKFKDQQPDAVNFLELPLYMSFFEAYALAVYNAIVIDLKVDKDLFLSFLKFYGDQDMLC